MTAQEKLYWQHILLQDVLQISGYYWSHLIYSTDWSHLIYKHCWISIFFSKCKVTSRTLDHREHGYYYALFTNVKLHRSISERFSSEHFLQVWRLVTGESAIGAHLPSLPLFCLTCHTVRSCTVALLLLMRLLIHTEIKLIFQFPSSPPGIVIRLN